MKFLYIEWRRRAGSESERARKAPNSRKSITVQLGWLSNKWEKLILWWIYIPLNIGRTYSTLRNFFLYLKIFLNHFFR